MNIAAGVMHIAAVLGQLKRYQLAELQLSNLIGVEITLALVTVRHMHVQLYLACLLATSLVWYLMIHTLGLVLLSGISIRSRARTLSESGFRDKYTYIHV